MSDDGGAGEPTARERGPVARALRLAALAVAVAVALSAPWWGRAALSRLSFFRLRAVEVQGARFLPPAEFVAGLGLDTTQSVWMDLGPIERRIVAHPQVRAVQIERKLPGTLVVRVRENLPVALVPGRGGFRALDAEGDTLPIDPSRVEVDVPILVQRDTALLRLLADVRRVAPPLYDRISDVRRAPRGELTLRLARVAVRAPAGVSAARLAEILPVERDLARRRARVVELDLRYRDQVIARLQ
ncbi:MAG TPA: FtsQ-type POTRA domain-containing protein [Gemmatimonadaceae bacterium]